MSALLTLLSERATTLLIALILSLLFGWLIGRFLNLHVLVDLAASLAQWLGRKLNKAKRDAATRAWRGVIMLLLLLLPAALLGFWIDHGPRETAIAILMLMLTVALQASTMLRLWRQARARSLKLQSTQPHYLFADTHAVLRFHILAHSESFAIGIVGVGLWYLLLGMAGVAAYLVLALTAAQFTDAHADTRLFGSVARSLFAASDALPRLLATGLLLLAALPTPGTHILAAARHATGSWPAFVAQLLGIALGGPMPVARRTKTLDWVGNGTAQLETRHLERWLMLWAVALVWLAMLAIPGLFYANLLKS